MNKKLIAAAIAAAVSAPAAMADVTVYGKLHMSVDFMDMDSGLWDGTSITDRDSRIGFKGSEDLGNGLKAVWKTEWAIDLDGGDQTVDNSRDNYLGLAGSFGTVLMAGNINHPYKSAFGKYDFFADTAADWDNTIGMDDNRADNALVYISPKFSGFQFSGASVQGENAQTGNDGIADAWSVAGTYAGGGLMAAIAYEDIITADNFRIGAGYKMDAFAVAATYENVDPAAAGSDTDRWTIQGSFAMGNNTLKAMYGNEDTGTTESDAWAIGVDHKMSKRTKAYALYVDSERGLRSPSAITGSGGVSAAHYGGGGGSGFSLGMVHSF